jgi:signal transduction histidine kinase/CheY-like chemotaxis protein
MARYRDVKPPERPALPTQSRAILAEQVRVIYIEGQRLILTGVAVALILVWVLWNHVAHAVLLGWLGAFVVYALVRLAMVRAYRRRVGDDLDQRVWMIRALWALALGGSLWCAACFLFYVPGRIEYQLFLVTILLGAVVSGLVTLAVHLPAYLVFILPFLAATAVRYGMENDALHVGIALAAFAILFIFVNFARYIQNSFVESLKLRMALAERNQELAERNHEVERANLARSRFLAAASHDLRQPLHALNLFATQLERETDPVERGRVVAGINSAVAAMNELFNALLDISRLDAGVLTPSKAEFPVRNLLTRIETTFGAAAREKGLRLRIIQSEARVCSDFILLERILLNLVSNAVRYTRRGSILVGCRRRGDSLCIEVRDSGIGIPEDQQRNIFSEFYQLAPQEPDGRAGLGLGLAIVDRLSRLLDHPVALRSRPDAGSCFSVVVPLAVRPPDSDTPAAVADATPDPLRDKLIVVIDDDALVLEAMRGLLQGWGCRVVLAATDTEALMRLARDDIPPDLIISDYRLANGRTGVQAIARLREALGAPVPAFLITGDTAPELLREAGASGFHLLHKPVAPMTMRAMVNQLLGARPDVPGSGSSGRQLAAGPSRAM